MYKLQINAMHCAVYIYIKVKCYTTTAQRKEDVTGKYAVRDLKLHMKC